MEKGLYPLDSGEAILPSPLENMLECFAISIYLFLSRESGRSDHAGVWGAMMMLDGEIMVMV